MKNAFALFSFLVITATLCKAQDEKPLIPEYNEQTKQYEYTYVGTLKDSTQDPSVSFERVRTYIYRELQTDKNKVVTNDEKTEISFDCSIKAEVVKGFGYSINTSNFAFKVNIRFKQGRIRIYIDNFLYQYIMNTSQGQRYFSQDLGQLKNYGGAKKVKQNLSDLLYTLRKNIKKAANGSELASPSENTW